MHARFPTRFALIICLAVLSNCTTDEAQEQLGAFGVDIRSNPFRLSFTHHDGLRIDTLGEEAISFRSATARYASEFGAFDITEKPKGDWRKAQYVEDIEVDDKKIKIVLLDVNEEPIGEILLTVDQESLRIVARSSLDDNRVSMNFACDAPSAGGFLGFGAQTHDVNHRGQVVPVWVSEQGIGKIETDERPALYPLVGTRHQSYISVPTMVAPRGDASYGFHLNSDYRSIWDLCATHKEALKVEVWESVFDLLISPGPSPLDVVRQQTAHNGRVPLGPDWTFGVWMEKVGGTQAVLDEAAWLRREEIPASAIWSEDWRGAKRQGNSYILEEDWRWDEVLYPNLPETIEELHRLGLKFQVYFNTFIAQSADVWDEAHRDDHFVRRYDNEPYIFEGVKFEPTGLAELFRPETRAWVQKELETALALGVDGWMADYAEWYPADALDFVTHDGSSPEAAHNRYPVVWAETNRDAIEASGRDDVVVFHRSAYSGSQGKAHVIWAGDQRTSFQADDGLPTIIPILIGLGVTGFPIVTHDIAGYVSATNPPSTKDLFFRWTSLGALAPIMRTHHGRDADLNWRWSRDEETISHFRRWANLHTRLFPVFKGLAQLAAKTGAPIIRPLAFAEPGRAEFHDIKDSYLIGDSLLVAPIVTATTSARKVMLPSGKWFDWFDGQSYEGQIDVTLPLDAVGLFARAGSIAVLLPEGVLSLAQTSTVTSLYDVENQRTVRLWLGASNTMTSEDAGEHHLTSAPDPQPPFTVQGGTVVEQNESRLLVRGSSDVELVLTDKAGQKHTFSSSGTIKNRILSFEIYW
jgi:sulfoquinovosidase